MQRLLCTFGVLISQCIPIAAAASPVLHVTVQPLAARSVAIGAQRVPMLTLQLRQECGADALVSAITLRHRGLGDARDVEQVYAFHRGKRVSNSGRVRNRKGLVTVRFRPAFAIRSCEQLSMDILADFSQTSAAAGEHSLVVLSAADVETDPPQAARLQTSGARGVAKPVGEAVGTVTVEYLPLPRPLSYGPGRVVGRIRIQADGRNDQRITAMTFTNDGSAHDADLQNFVLATSSHQALSGRVPGLDLDRVRLVLDPPLIIRRNAWYVFLLRADIRASSRRTVRFLIDEPADIEVERVR